MGFFQKRVVRTKLDICYSYHWVDTSAGGLLVPSVSSIQQSVFLIISINKTNVLLLKA
jgi:hypothetical protein